MALVMDLAPHHHLECVGEIFAVDAYLGPILQHPSNQVDGLAFPFHRPALLSDFKDESPCTVASLYEALPGQLLVGLGYGGRVDPKAFGQLSNRG